MNTSHNDYCDDIEKVMLGAIKLIQYYIHFNILNKLHTHNHNTSGKPTMTHFKSTGVLTAHGYTQGQRLRSVPTSEDYMLSYRSGAPVNQDEDNPAMDCNVSAPQYLYPAHRLAVCLPQRVSIVKCWTGERCCVGS